MPGACRSCFLNVNPGLSPKVVNDRPLMPFCHFSVYIMGFVAVLGCELAFWGLGGALELDLDGLRVLFTLPQGATGSVWVWTLGLAACFAVSRWTCDSFVRVAPPFLPPKKYRFMRAVCCVVVVCVVYTQFCTMLCCFV